MVSSNIMPRQRIGKMYRIQIFDDTPCLFCLPALSKNGGSGVGRVKRVRNKNVVRPFLPNPVVAVRPTVYAIPKNSFVKIVDYHEMYGQNWFEVEWSGFRYMVTEAQVMDYFVLIHIRPEGGR